MSFFSLNLISLLLVLLLTGFFSTQGTFSTLLTLVMAVFASVLAMGVGPALAGVMPASVNEYAQGIGFLGTFVVAFVGLRVACDILLPKNVPLPKWPEKIAAGAVGFLAGMIIMGAVCVGLEMLPFGTAVLGNGSIDGDTVSGRPLVARFMTGIFYLTNGGSMGGKSLASVHPDLGAEMTRKRHTVRPNTRQTLGADLVNVEPATLATKEQVEKFKIVPHDAASRILLLRTTIDKAKAGAQLDVTQPNADTSFDIGEGSAFFDITAAQVRLVVKDQAGYRDYSPIGYLNHGGENTDLRKKKEIAFEPMDLANGMVLADYDDKESKAVIEWVFELPEKAEPLSIELKRSALKPVWIDSDKKYEALAVGKYPPLKIFAHQCDITIVVQDDAGQPKAGAMVWIVDPSVQKRIVHSLLQAGKNTLETNVNRDVGNPWPDAAAGGVPGYGDLSGAYRVAVDTVNKGNDDPLQWTQVLQVLFFGQAQRDGKQMVQRLGAFFQSQGDFGKLMNSAEMRQSKLDSYVTDNTGTHAATTVRPGNVVIIVAVPSVGNDTFKLWVLEKKITDKDSKLELTLPKDEKPTYQCDTTK